MRRLFGGVIFKKILFLPIYIDIGLFYTRAHIYIYIYINSYILILAYKPLVMLVLLYLADRWLIWKLRERPSTCDDTYGGRDIACHLSVTWKQYHTSLDRDAAIAIGALLCNRELFSPNADTLNWHSETLSEPDCEKRIIPRLYYI